MKNIQIAIDGPASAGKSTVAKILAKELNFIYCDTGAMYRALTYLGLKHQVNLSDGEQLLQLLEENPISFKAQSDGQLVFVGTTDVTEAIRTNEVNAHVSEVAAVKAVREKMVLLQQEIASNNGIVMDGRDIGTAVLPSAQVKIFLIASVKERAQRRYQENLAKGIGGELREIEASIEKRDYLDTHREVSPLTKAKDAIEVDTTGLNIEEVVEKIEEIIKKQVN